MLKVNFYELNTVDDSQLLFAVIMARYEGKWIFVRHKNRSTWEIPGGHREENENINITASRELIEETGAEDFSIVPVSFYSVNTGEAVTFGKLFYADVKSLGELPDYEITEIRLFDNIPESLTYPLIQPYLFKKIEGFCESNRS
ncbi:Nudix hydrolase domain protein [Acididesulfobacillus acetoxydans]|uniref:NUDIX hydrolase n=1 Tax=Acididesulfobacillus acetoxydans TaxID=1561005 RepID=A0A8S0W494_9FIRM|nr:NUDIX domain-containing protein [Acididesulfobacillus acetoxydans]CAA7602308.1 Nudix hydrolase domain protein [Acididesulfobacillus acetoxydans]CEJ08763.1 NUDIX hydrolase [Acididesulfobacillus acetoxydans]